MNEQHGWYFTAPWDPVMVRRGDALGFRASANYFGNLVAPGLSNRTFDARWITLLSWCLKWSHVVWQSAGGRDLSDREGQRARYAWLRPLELLWIDRALKSGQPAAQLPGRRSIERWHKSDRKLPNFSMSPDRFRRYRQTGLYGAYRVTFRTIRGLTTGDGWTPGSTALELARLVNASLPPEARLSQTQFESGTPWNRWKGDEARYWIKHGWTSWQTPGGWLPTPRDAALECLPDEERRLLEQVIFGDDSVRRTVAKVLANAKEAESHADLCDALAGSSALLKKMGPVLAPLPAFARLADAAMDAMRELWCGINHDEIEPATSITKLAQSTQLQLSFDRLRKLATSWLSASAKKYLPPPYEYIATRLAEVMCNASSPTEQIRALAAHHLQYGGGLRWFREQGGKLIALIPDTGIPASNYGFRLRSLCRLAAQCGVADMRHALNAHDASGRRETSDEEGDTP